MKQWEENFNKDVHQTDFSEYKNYTKSECKCNKSAKVDDEYVVRTLSKILNEIVQINARLKDIEYKLSLQDTYNLNAKWPTEWPDIRYVTSNKSRPEYKITHTYNTKNVMNYD